MSIESTCQGCGKRLRVADEHAGQLAKCPYCQAQYTVPQPAAQTSDVKNASATPLDPADRWQLKTPDGRVFGPVARADLDRWLAEGRINAASQILRAGASQWLWAAQIYPQLAAAPANTHSQH